MTLLDVGARPRGRWETDKSSEPGDDGDGQAAVAVVDRPLAPAIDPAVMARARSKAEAAKARYAANNGPLAAQMRALRAQGVDARQAARLLVRPAPVAVAKVVVRAKAVVADTLAREHIVSLRPGPHGFVVPTFREPVCLYRKRVPLLPVDGNGAMSFAWVCCGAWKWRCARHRAVVANSAAPRFPWLLGPDARLWRAESLHERHWSTFGKRTRSEVAHLRHTFGTRRVPSRRTKALVDAQIGRFPLYGGHPYRYRDLRPICLLTWGYAASRVSEEERDVLTNIMPSKPNLRSRRFVEVDPYSTVVDYAAGIATGSLGLTSTRGWGLRQPASAPQYVMAREMEGLDPDDQDKVARLVGFHEVGQSHNGDWEHWGHAEALPTLELVARLNAEAQRLKEG